MRLTYLRATLVAALLLPAAAMAQTPVGGTVVNGAPPAPNLNSTAPLTIDQSTGALRILCTSGCSGGSGSTGSVTAPGTNGTQAQAVQGINGGVPQNVALPAGAVTTTGALQPPTAGAGKIIDTSVALTANTSTTLVAARGTPGDRIGIEIQCDGTGVVGIDMKGGTLTSAAAVPRVIPSGSYPLYTPLIATQTAITAYTGTAQTCRVTEYLR